MHPYYESQPEKINQTDVFSALQRPHKRLQFLRESGRCYNRAVMTAKETLDASLLEMRWRCLSLAADLDRVERATGGADLLRDDRRVQTLRQALHVLLESTSNRAEQVQMLFSDMSPAPNRQSQIGNRQ